MKKSERMKNFFKASLVLLAAASGYQASAFTYSDADLLLVFRKEGNFNDVEFNLGSVSNYLGKAAGTKVNVTNWDLATVKASYNDSLANVKFVLTAATSTIDTPRRVWLTSANLAPLDPPTDLSGSRWSALRSKVDAIGNQAQSLTVTNASEVYTVAQSDPSSYSYVVTSGSTLDAATIGGLAPFPVENENPTTLLFYELKISNASTKPAAALIGSFCVRSDGTMVFTAGPLAPITQPTIVNYGHAGTTNSVTFNTQDCVNYRLRSTSDISVPTSPLSTIITGDGSSKVLTDISSSAATFYKLEAFR